MTTPKSWKDIEELALELSQYRGEAHDTFRESIINDLLERGYSRARAEQLVDEAEARAKSKR